MLRKILISTCCIVFFIGFVSLSSAANKVDLNTASFSQLEKIPGIGPDMAKKIIEHRKKVGKFKSLNELLAIKGIGEKTVEKIEPYLTIGSSGASDDSKAATKGKININTASLSELTKLPGVGPKTAEKIVDYRKANGPFKKPSDIKKIKGIGDKTYQKMADMISVN